jgi:glycosyltransferase involved in cell wall biosynthesis
VDRVSLAYVSRYGSRARALISHRGHAIDLTPRDSQTLFEMLLGGRRPVGVRTWLAASLARGVTARITGREAQRATLLHTSHTGMEHLHYYRRLRRRGVRSVMMIHDLIPITHAEYCRPHAKQQHRRRIHAALQYADGLVTNSADTLKALSSEAVLAGLPLPQHVVAPLAPGIVRSEAMSRPLASPYFVMVGTIEARKNHWLILQVWRRLVERFGSAAPRLVLIGRRGWESENAIDMLERSDALREHVIEIGDCDDRGLQQWLQHACALLFPSFVEGYGMPLVEALTLGVPVIASPLDVFREIAGDIPDYVDALDGPGWVARIESFSDAGASARANQLQRMAKFQTPTWDDHFSRVDALLAQLAVH